jgi:hypothetical protein
VIIIAGQGRSGTSLVARVYKELGFDPGGAWDESANMGFETAPVHDANERIIEALGMEEAGRRFRFIPDRRLPKMVKERGKRLLPLSVRTRLIWLVKQPPWRSNARLQLIAWERFDEAVDRLRPLLHEVSRTHPVAKDPRFSWTLPVWVASGVPIEHVVVCVRSVDVVIERRIDYEWIPPKSKVSAKTWFVFGLGLCMTTIYDHRLSHGVLRFPDFVDRPEEVFDALRFPEQVPRERFLEAFARSVRKNLVHDFR